MSELLGSVEVAAGPMYAGKSTMGLGWAARMQRLHGRVAIFQPAVDIRTPGRVVSKMYEGAPEADGPSNCIRIGSIFDITAANLKGARHVLIDEANMLAFRPNGEPVKGRYLELVDHLRGLGVTALFLTMLDVAANGEMFEMYKEARENGAKPIPLEASCMAPKDDPESPFCTKAARNTLILEPETGRPFRRSSMPQLVPQGILPVIFIPACPDHFALSRDDTAPDFQEHIARSTV